MFDVQKETPITMAAAARLIPQINSVPGEKPRKPLHWRTVYNWTTRGKRGVFLEAVPLGGLLVTSRQAIDRFFERLTTARQQRIIDRRSAPVRVGSKRARQQSSEYRQTRSRLATEHGI